jgi:hypothetical protein
MLSLFFPTCHFDIIPAEVRDRAERTGWFSRCADRPPMRDEDIGENPPVLFRKQVHKVLFGTFGIL